ncbi:MAG: bifunctional precorrin-2 dehydrogenase/sirohydrochlorin ferrochelatase [Acidaminococcaceae bacterium]
MVVYPINLKIAGKSCAVIGGGMVACRKVKSLLAAGADVTVLSPHLMTELAEMAEKKQFKYIARPYQKGDLTGFYLVICATDNFVVNQMAASEAESLDILVNVTDAPELGNFSVPAQIKRGDLLLTVSTGGKSPAMAKMLRQELAEHYGEEYALYLDMIDKVRQETKQKLATPKQRELFWRETIDEEILALLRQGLIKEAEAKICHAASSIGIES